MSSGRRLNRPLASVLVHLASFFLPWSLRRRWLAVWFGYELHPSSRIGLSLFMPGHLVLGEGARIGHLNMCRRVDRVELADHAVIGQWNWLTGTPANDAEFYQHVEGRRAEFTMGPHAALTSRHYVDCAEGVTIGEFTTVAGIRSQIFTHSLDIEKSRQLAEPISIGAYVMVGTGTTLLPGASVPDRSLIGAGSVVTRALKKPLYLYAGAPAQPIRELSPDLKYFHRKRGHIN